MTTPVAEIDFTPPDRFDNTYSNDAMNTFESSRPPSLGYDLRQRRFTILLFCALVLIDSMIIPVVLYFVLWYYTDLSHSTTLIGGSSITQYLKRSYQLFRKLSTCRVEGGGRLTFDFFHWVMGLAYVLIIAEMIVGTVPDKPLVRVIAMPIPSLCFVFGTQLLLVEILCILGIRAPLRISSTRKGEPLRPGVYSIIEDIVAVDGGGGTGFRRQLQARYEISRIFRQMLHYVSFLWAIPAFVVGSGTIAIIFNVDRNLGYVLGWCLPFAWAMAWVPLTFWVVRRMLVKEANEWDRMRERDMR